MGEPIKRAKRSSGNPSDKVKQLVKDYTTDSRTKAEGRSSVKEGETSDPIKTQKIAKSTEKKIKAVIVESTIDEEKKNSGVNEAIKNLKIEGTTIIRNREDAKRVVDILKTLPERIHAWDTETINIDPKEQSPVGNGTIICAQVFVGPDIDFGNGPRLFIDNYADAEGTIMEFKEYLEDPKYLKCFHNYGFDRHMFFNHGINVRGLGGDTMHMARLHDPSRIPG